MKPKDLALLVLHVSARCDQTCAHCSIWKGKGGAHAELGLEAREVVIRQARTLGARGILFTGGEPLLCAHIEPLARLAHDLGLSVQIATNGLGLARATAWLQELVDELYVSFEGPEPVYDALRGRGMYARLATSVRSVTEKMRRPRLVARAVISSRNAGTLDETVASARSLGFDAISFLPLDTMSEAFGGDPAARLNLALRPEDVAELHASIDRLAAKGELGRFVAEDERKLRAMANFLGEDVSLRRAPRCNAPEWSSVVEADGGLRPCFFQPVATNIRDQSLRQAREDAPYREALEDLGNGNPICASCVCPKFVSSGPAGIGARVKAILGRVLPGPSPRAGSPA